MVTDWLLIKRLGSEIEARLRGARVGDAGLLDDGRIGLVMRPRKGGSTILAVDAFATPPAATIEPGELGIAVEPGFLRALATTLRGMALESVRARRGDRLLRLTFESQSRFGVGDRVELYLELVPRFGNVVLVKNATVVAAAKEFSLAENPARAVAPGQKYVLPPLPPGRENAEGEDTGEPLYVYRRDGALLQASLVPLERYPGAQCARASSALEIFAEARAQRVARGEAERSTRRRQALLRRLEERRKKYDLELLSLAEKRRAIGERDALRAEGDAIFAGLHERPDGERDEAKERAAKIFARYKKLGAMLPHVERREADVRGALEAIEALAWETERAAAEDLSDVEAAVGGLDAHRRPQASPRVQKRKRAPLEVRTASGARIVVGRSPTENADVTFRIARPNDLWFHAQGIPGAHVVLARDDREEPCAEDIERAAALAAFFSKAKGSGKVPIDYTLRKHVRKQRNAPPGLVWYVNPKTVLAEPRGLDT